MKWSFEFSENLILPRAHQSFKRKLLKDLGEFHKTVTLMKHFVLGADRRYGYAKRTKGYMLRKARKYHHQIPLVYTGHLKSLVSVVGRIRVIGQADGWRFDARSYFPMKDELKHDIEVVLPEEIERHNKMLRRNYVAGYSQYCRQRKKRSS